MALRQILTITGPTCSGKSTAEALLNSYGYGKVISHTSRQARQGEVNGSAYYFVKRSYFDLRPEDFLEQVEFDGNRYGVHASEVRRLVNAGCAKIVIVAEPNGVLQIIKWAERNDVPCRSVFLHVDDKVRYERFLRRCTAEPDIEAMIRRASPRLVTMQEESRWKIDWSDRIYWDILRCTELEPLEVCNLIVGKT